MNTEKRNYYPLRVGKSTGVIVSDTDPQRPTYKETDLQWEQNHYGGNIIAESLPPGVAQDMVDAYNEKFGPVVKVGLIHQTTRRLGKHTMQNLHELHDKIINKGGNFINSGFLISQGWKQSDDKSELSFTSENKFTIEIIRESDGLETHIYDEYGFHDGMRYNGATPTQEQYFVLNDLLKMTKVNSAHLFTEGSEVKTERTKWATTIEDMDVAPTLDEQIKFLDDFLSLVRLSPFGDENRYFKRIKENLIAVKRCNESPAYHNVDVVGVISDLISDLKDAENMMGSLGTRPVPELWEPHIQNAEAALGMLQAFKKGRELPKYEIKVMVNKETISNELFFDIRQVMPSPNNDKIAKAIIEAIDKMLKLRGL